MDWSSLIDIEGPAGAEPLRAVFGRLNNATVDGFLESLPNRDQNELWNAIHRHVQVIVDTLAAATNGESSYYDFNLVGRRVLASRSENITGSIKELFEQPASDAVHDDHANVGDGTYMCRIEHTDGSLETVSVVEVVPRIVGDDSDRNNRGGSEAELSGDRGLSSSSVEALTSVATIALAWLNYQTGNKSGQFQKRLEVPANMRSALGLLHDILFELSGLDGLALQEAIAKVCEAMWVGERKGAELLVPQLVPFLLLKALSEDARDADVKRLFGVRGALLLMDLDDASSDTLKGLLLRCTMHPRFLKTEIGRRFVVFLFGLQPEFIGDVHSTIKNQVPHASHKALCAYGEIYLRAWRDSAGAPGTTGTVAPNAFRRAIEGCLQELMQGYVLANLTATHSALRAVLQPLHRAKCRSTGTPGAAAHDTMLTKLWEPIIWRSLAVANPMARVQATRALADVFPLQTFASAGDVENDRANDTLLQKQFDALRLLLSDRDPRVRVAAIEATAEVLTDYWEAIPSKISRALITHFTAKLANDDASCKVREMAVKGLTRLLANPLSHGVLKAALPSMRNVLHDKSERVRACFIGLLQKLSTVRGIAFVHVVPVDDLLARLAQDSNCKNITDAMAKLLAPSFFPSFPTSRNTPATDHSYDSAPLEQGQQEKVHLGRAVASLQKNPDATFAFYGAVKDYIAPRALARLAILLFNYAHTVSSTLTSPPAAATGSGEVTVREQQHGEVLGCMGYVGDTRHLTDILSTPSTLKGQCLSPTERKSQGQKNMSTALHDVKAISFTKVAMAKLKKRLTMMSRALGCAAIIWEGLEAATANRSHPLPVELRTMLNKTVGDKAGLPAVYALLMETGNSLSFISSSCSSSPTSRSLFRHLDDARCSALRLASCLAKGDIPALAPMLLSIIQSGGYGEDYVVTESVRCLALLCKWGCVEEVLALLKESLDAAFCGAVGTLISIPTAAAKPIPDHSLIDEDGELERSSKRKRKPPTRRALASQLDPTVKTVEIPTLPVAVAVKLIGALTSGTEMLSDTARLTFLKNDTAISSLIECLGAVKQVISRGLKDVNETSSLPMSVLVETIEVYGRLLLHRCVVLGDAEKYCGDDFGPFEGGGTPVSTCNRQNESRGGTNLRASLSQDMLDLIRWAMDELLPVATARSADTEAFTLKLKMCAGDFLSPPAKLQRPSGTTPGNATPPSRGAVPLENSEMKTPMLLGRLLQARQTLAKGVISHIFIIASDWAHCCVGLPGLSSATQAIMKEIGINVSGGDVKDLDISNTVIASVVVPLSRLCYQLAFRESQGGSIDKMALRILLRSAHFQGHRTNADEDDTQIHGADDGDSECQGMVDEGVRDGTVETQYSPRLCLEKLLMIAANRSHITLSNVTEIIVEHLLRHTADTREFGCNGSAVNVSRSSVLPFSLNQSSGRAVLSVVLGSGGLVANAFVKHVVSAAKDISPPLLLSDKDGKTDYVSLHLWLADPVIALLRAVCVSGEASLQLKTYIWFEVSSSFPQITSDADLVAVSSFFNYDEISQEG